MRRGWGRFVVRGVVAMLLTACGDGGGAATTASTTAASSTADPAPGTAPVSRSAPRWETVATLAGSGRATTPRFDILDAAIQWRIRWTCETGGLRITSDPPPRKGRPVAEGACPAEGEGYAIHTGAIRLAVDTDGPWVAVVDQQIDTPLVEEPLDGMAPETLIAEGGFGPVEMEGKGTARLYELADGRRILRFEDDFEVSTNTDLFVWLSEAESPTTSKEAVDSPYVEIGNLKSTLGSQNYVVPADVATEKVRSVVIWCEPVAIVYAIAPLTRS